MSRLDLNRKIGWPLLVATAGFLAIVLFALMPADVALAQVPVPGDGQSEPAKPVPKRQSKEAKASKPRPRREPDGFYMGRQIADVMSWEGAEWLFRETRVEEEQPEAMLSALKIPRGATVADVGAGAGYHSIRLGRRVGPKGTVLATDLQPQMLAMLRDNARAAGITNIKPIRATQDRHQASRGESRSHSHGGCLPRVL